MRPDGPFCVNVTLFENLRRLARAAVPVPELRDPRIPWSVRADALGRPGRIASELALPDVAALAAEAVKLVDRAEVP